MPTKKSLVIFAASVAVIGGLLWFSADKPPAEASLISGNSVTVTSLTPGNTAGKLGKAEDAAHSSGDTIVGVGAVVETTTGGTSATDGEYALPTLNSDGALRVQVVPHTYNGASVYRNLDIDETTGTTTQQVKATAGVLYRCAVTNDTASTKEYVKFYNAASLTGSAAGTETPVITLPIAGATTLTLDFGAIGYYFDTGLTIAATTGIADNDTGAPATNAVVVNCLYK